ncbi:Rieske 2Fe-2S domain-containing protein [Geodermatophilus sp. DSM 45219]|uniref:Rieske 2Fe-2S domain-containing protein n=1 Tax=Geodermatophilus sp. DSM 45219 TaxID=1881103 RepID=UPI002100B151|nr:Rieske 2Fe-2S domain-containing protein [Geodermatophilus sp. DSM 45219]
MGTSTGWFPVARAAEVGSRPLPVGAGGRAYVLVRLRPDGEVSAFPATCPHRLVPLSAGTVVDGRLTCPYHGWQYDGEGRCVTIPALGPDGTPPPRADLTVPWAVEERHGWVWLAPERTAVPTPPRPGDATVAEPVPAPPQPAGPVLGNLHPPWRRRGTRWRCPASCGPVAGCRSGCSGAPGRCAAPTASRSTRRRTASASGSDAPTDPGVATGERPVRLRRRVTAVHRAPFQLLLRREHLDSGAVTTVHFLLQPEDADSTRVYTRLLLSAGPGRPLPAPRDVGREVALAQRVLDEDLALTAHLAGQGLPPAGRDELHLRADRLGVALRRALCDFTGTARGARAAA